MSKLHYECIHGDTCLPDYWAGHHLAHVAIPVHKGIRLCDIKQDIRTEISQGAVMGHNEDARLLSADMVRPGEEALADALTDAVYRAIRKIGGRHNFQWQPFADTLGNDGAEDEVYAYFVFRKIEE